VADAGYLLTMQAAPSSAPKGTVLTHAHTLILCIGVALVVAISSALAYHAGRGSVEVEQARAEVPPVLAEEARSGELEALLAKVEATPTVDVGFTDRLAESRASLSAVPAPVGTVPTDGWALQVLSTTDEAAATKAMETLVAAKFPAYRSPALVAGVPTWQVRVGGYPDRDAAASAGAAVAAAAGIEKVAPVKAP
jgi:hypothetical protein